MNDRALIEKLISGNRVWASEIKARDPEFFTRSSGSVVEEDFYATSIDHLANLSPTNRRQRLALLGDTAQALYGVGFISDRHLDGVAKSLRKLEGNSSLDLDTYREELHFLARMAEWSGRWLEFNFGEAVERWAPMEPMALRFTQDRLRGSPLLSYAAVVDGLLRDASLLAGTGHEIFGEPVGAGLRALNPGLAQGRLVAPAGGGPPVDGFQRDGIYLLPESTADLPSVSGILTRGEGSSLSHVQLLARNLGVPNVVVGRALVPRIRERHGEQVVLAVTPLGVVQISEWSSAWQPILGIGSRDADFLLEANIGKLDLRTDLVPLSRLRAKDSGVLAGPKGANLGELKHRFGNRVPDGFVIPFGVFRRLLDEYTADAGG